MRPLLLAALLLAAPMAAERGVVPIPPREAPIADDVIPVINGSAVWPGDVSCTPHGTVLYVPSPERTEQIARAVLTILQIDLDQGVLTTPVPYAVWRATTKLYWPPQFRDRPTYVMAAVPPGYAPNCFNASGEPRLCVCAAGIGYLTPVIDVSDPDRTEKLIAWETLNAQLGLLNRADLWDGPVVSGIVERTANLIGGWRFK